MTPVTLVPEAPAAEREFGELREEAARCHGHLWPGQVRGVRMAWFLDTTLREHERRRASQ